MTLLNVCLICIQSFIEIGGAVLEKIEHMIQRDIHLLLLGLLIFPSIIRNVVSAYAVITQESFIQTVRQWKLI